MNTAAISFGFGVYFAILAVITVLATRRTKSSADYAIGGRSLGVMVIAFSAGATELSGWVLLGLPRLAFVSGQEALWTIAGLLTGVWLNWTLLARKLRERSEELNSITVPSLLRLHLGGDSMTLQRVSAIVILVFFTIYVSAQLVAGGKLLSSSFDIDYQLAVVISCGIILVYTTVGGFIAVSWTDVFQALLMLAALIFIPLFALSLAASDAPAHAEFPSLVDHFGVFPGAIAVVSALAWGLGYFGQPHLIMRFKALKDPALMNRARNISFTWTAACMLAACLAGYAGSVFVGAEMMAPLDDPERVFIVLIETVTHPIVAGVLLSAILAAAMSTADSQLLVAGTSLGYDFSRNKSKHQLMIGRLAVMAVAIVAGAVAFDDTSGVLGLVAYAWSGLGSTFGAVFLVSVLWPHVTAKAAIAGMVVGATVTVGWRNVSGGIFDVYELLPAFLLASATIIGVSMVQRGRQTA